MQDRINVFFITKRMLVFDKMNVRYILQSIQKDAPMSWSVKIEFD